MALKGYLTVDFTVWDLLDSVNALMYDGLFVFMF